MLAALACLGGCAATVPPDAGGNPADPLERMNRHVYAFNDNFDERSASRCSRGYNAVRAQGGARLRRATSSTT